MTKSLNDLNKYNYVQYGLYLSIYIIEQQLVVTRRSSRKG